MWLTFPLESYGGIQRQISAHFTLHFGNLAAASQVSRRKQTCSKSLAWSKGFHSLSQHFLALFPARPEHCAHTTNMSKASGLKSSICYKKNEVSKQGLFVVGGCQMGWGLPGRLYHVEIIPRTRKCAPSNIPELIQEHSLLGSLASDACHQDHQLPPGLWVPYHGLACGHTVQVPWHTGHCAGLLTWGDITS